MKMKNDLKTISSKESDSGAKNHGDPSGAIKRKSNREKSLTLDHAMPDSPNKLAHDSKSAFFMLKSSSLTTICRLA